MAEQTPNASTKRSKVLRRLFLVSRIGFYLFILLTFVGIEAYYHSPTFRMFVLLHRHDARTAPSYEAVMQDPSPADLLAYSDDPAEVHNLLASGKYVSRPISLGPAAVAVLNNTAFDRWSLAEYGRLCTPAVFAHGRNLPGQDPLLVYVNASPMKEDPFHRLFLFCGADNRSRQRIITGSDFVILRAPGDTVRIYQGQIDPADSSRFTIRIDFNKKPYNLTGRLLSGDRITLTPDAGQLAWFGKDYWWAPPGIDVPDQLESGCFTALPAVPTHYLGIMPHGALRLFAAK